MVGQGDTEPRHTEPRHTEPRHVEPRDEFLSEEDMDIANMTEAELDAWCVLWLRMAQATNDLDAGAYSHGVFEWDPTVPRPRSPGD